ncbi:MAG TPA: aminoglycoside phosphotransferase family protein [Dermatophilaceae bacterium]|nr:aminoglycoside phosphotransferase family protein [Dermatophilaceae bacterium]
MTRLIAEAMDQWSLTPDGPLRTGWTAAVLPVRREGLPLALKVVWPCPDTAGEHRALRHWAGRGAVRLVAADPGRGALLLERLDADRDLRILDVDAACEVIGEVLGQLHVPAPPTIRRLSDFSAHNLARLTARTDLPRRFVSRVAGLVDELTSDQDCDATLLHVDLHDQNVLAAERAPWLAIDPQPMAGHPGVELHPMLRNRVAELGTGSAFRWSVRRRVDVVCDAAGIDDQVARLWTVVVCGFQAGWAAEEGNHEGVSFNIALAKALED